MEPRQPTVSKYDNDVTILYKYALYYGHPISYIVKVTDEQNNFTYRSIEDVILEGIQSQRTLAVIYADLIDLNPKLNVDMMKRAFISLTQVLSNQGNNDLVSAVLASIVELNKIANIPETTINMSVRNIIFIYEDIDEKYKKSVIRDLKIAENIYSMQDDYDNVMSKPQRLLPTTVSHNSAIFSFVPKVIMEDGSIVSISKRLGYYIYNSILLSEHICYAQYNDDEGNRIPKIYKSNRLDVKPKYSSMAAPKDQTQKSNTIYMTLWLGNEEDDFYSSPKESFHTMILSLETGQLTVNIPFNIRGNKTENERVSISYIQAALPKLQLGVKTEIKVRADTQFIPLYQPYIPGQQLTLPTTKQIEMVEYLFHHLCLLNGSFSPVLYVEETGKSLPFKKRLDLHYRSPYTDIDEAETPTKDNYISNSASVSFTLSIRKVGITENIQTATPTGLVPVTMQDGYSYIHINITKADSREVIDEFLRYIHPILLIYWEYYNKEREDIMSFYNYFIEDNQTLDEAKRSIKLDKEMRKGKSGKVKSGTILSELYNDYSDVFGGSYSIKCQNKYVVPFKSKQEADQFTQQTFRHAGQVHNRSYLPFPAPPEKTMFYFSCPGDTYPYPGVRRNNTGHNEEKYPFVPCCFASDQTQKESKYKQYYLGQGKGPKKKTQDRLKRNAILEYERIGALPISIDNILSQYSENVGQMNRLGLPRSTSSFLHAVLYAIDDPEYKTMKDDESREAYVVKIRRHISTIVNPECMKQEFYDVDRDTVKKELGDSSIPMDPSLFYRAIEEAYDVNIYTFSTATKSNEDPGKIEIPRNKHFHTRPARPYRRTIIIFKHMGSETAALKYHQCDLVIDRNKWDEGLEDEEIDDTTIFDDSMTDICQGTLENSMRTVTWLMPDLSAYYNMYNAVDYLSLFKDTCRSQYIDSNGKARALSFQYTMYGYKSPIDVTVMIPPSQPLNLPHTSVLHTVPVNVALSIFNNPTHVTRQDNRTTGVWFAIVGIDSGIYIRTTGDDPKLFSLPEGKPDPLQVADTSVIHEITKMKKQLSFLMQLIGWVFDMGRNTIRRSDYSDYDGYTDAFFNMYVTWPGVDPSISNLDDDKVYDFSGLKNNLLPIGGDIDSVAISFIKTHIPHMIHRSSDGREKIVMTTDDLMEKVKYQMNTYLLNTFGVPELEIQDQIKNYYILPSDYTQQLYVETFTSVDNLEEWIQSNYVSDETKFTIHTKLDLSMSLTTEPYMYKDLDGNLFIIQNTYSTKIGSAAQIAEEWKFTRVNLGPAAKPQTKRDIRSKIIFGISSDGNLIPIQDDTNGSEEYIRLIFYGTNENWLSGQGGRYGAILDL